MSLITQIGQEGNVFALAPENARQVLLNSPVLSQRKLRQILALPEYTQRQRLLDLYFGPEESLEAALRLCAEAEQAVRARAVLLLLSDRYAKDGMTPVHALLATGAVHAHLVQRQLRCDCNLLVETGSARDAHHFACLIGFGATAVYPYLAYQTLYDMNRRGELKGREGEAPSEIGAATAAASEGPAEDPVENGHLLHRRLPRRADVRDPRPRAGGGRPVLPGTPSRIGGAGFADLEQELREQARAAETPRAGSSPAACSRPCRTANTTCTTRRWSAPCRPPCSGDRSLYQRYADAVNKRAPSTLRDLLQVVPAAAPLALDAVEPEAAVLKRFDSAGMSLGALSPRRTKPWPPA